MKRKSTLTVLISLVMLFANCSVDNKPKSFDYGQVENGKYVNSFFDFEVHVPEDWFVQNKEQTDHLLEVGKEIATGDDENLKSVIKASEVNTAYLLTMFQYEIGSPVDYNPSFMLLAENIQNAPGMKTGSDYLFQARKLLKLSQINYDYIDEDFEKATINGKDFYQLNCRVDYAGTTIHQRYYVTLKNRFAIVCIVSFINDEQEQNLVDIIKSIQFKDE